MMKKQSYHSIFARVYKKIRRAGQSFVKMHPLLDQSLGSFLRKIERQFQPYKHVLPDNSGLLHIHGLRLHYRPEDKGVTTSIFLYGEYESETTTVMSRLLSPGTTFVDLGANIGYFTLLGAKLVSPGGLVFAFEPVPSTFDVLVKNVHENGFEDLVVVVPKAISNAQQILRLYVPPDNSVSAHVELSGDVILSSDNLLEIESTSLDAFFDHQNWPPVNLIKMDIEGAELAALDGMQEICSRNRDLKLIMELNYNHLVRTGTDPRTIINKLQEYGFRYVVPLRKGYQKTLEMPRDFSQLVDIAKRATLNILCQRD